MAHPGGRPPKYTNPEDMQRLIDLYFLACRVRQKEDLSLLEVLDDDDLLVINDIDDIHPTVSGLAYVLHMSTQAFRNYEDKDEFLSTVKSAKQRIERYLEQHLYGTAVTGVIFNLKNNFSWKDKSEQDINAKVETRDTSALDAIRQAIESKSITD